MLYTPILLMLRFGNNPPIMLASIALGIQGILLLSLARIRPDIARYKDIFLGIFAMSSGISLYFYNYRIDGKFQIPILLLTLISIWYTYESIQLRIKFANQKNKN